MRVVGSAGIQRRDPPWAVQSWLFKLRAPQHSRARRPADPRGVCSPIARGGRQVAQKVAAPASETGKGIGAINQPVAISSPCFRLSALHSSGIPNALHIHRGSLHPAFSVLAPLVEGSLVIRPHPQSSTLKSRHKVCGWEGRTEKWTVSVAAGEKEMTRASQRGNYELLE